MCEVVFFSLLECGCGWGRLYIETRNKASFGPGPCPSLSLKPQAASFRTNHNEEWAFLSLRCNPAPLLEHLFTRLLPCQSDGVETLSTWVKCAKTMVRLYVCILISVTMLAVDLLVVERFDNVIPSRKTQNQKRNPEDQTKLYQHGL